MKKSQLVSAIKNVLAENKKQKLDENTIREIIREVLSEKQNINEEAHDFIRDIESALGKNPSPERVEQYLGRVLSDEEKEALVGDSRGKKIADSRGKKRGKKRRVIGYKFGQPVYAWVY